MKYVEEYRQPEAVAALADAIRLTATRPWRIMEVCGGQTHGIVKYGLDQLLPQTVELLHGPGCPVCVTPTAVIDAAITACRRPEVILCSFGDMLRVPGTDTDLLTAKARGGDVRVVYSPADAVRLARQEPRREVVFLAVGFETTAPANAHAVALAKSWGLANFSMIVAHVLVPPALTAILATADRRIDGFLAAGHVCTIMGVSEYEPIAAAHRVPIVVTGFEPVDIMQGLYLCLRQLEEGRAEVENQYARSVRADGNPAARSLVDEVFEVTSTPWRGLGELPASGLRLKEAYRTFDATARFPGLLGRYEDSGGCRAGDVLTGRIKPPACEAFGGRCTPDTPLGAPMVSSEGACAAYFNYRRGRS